MTRLTKAQHGSVSQFSIRKKAQPISPDLLLSDDELKGLSKFDGRRLSVMVKDIAKAQLAHCEPLIRADERARNQVCKYGTNPDTCTNYALPPKTWKLLEEERVKILSALEKEYPAIATWGIFNQLKQGVKP
jgi:hypothetical protein